MGSIANAIQGVTAAITPQIEAAQQARQMRLQVAQMMAQNQLRNAQMQREQAYQQGMLGYHNRMADITQQWHDESLSNRADDIARENQRDKFNRLNAVYQKQQSPYETSLTPEQGKAFQEFPEFGVKQDYTPETSMSVAGMNIPIPPMKTDIYSLPPTFQAITQKNKEDLAQNKLDWEQEFGGKKFEESKRHNIEQEKIGKRGVAVKEALVPSQILKNNAQAIHTSALGNVQAGIQKGLISKSNPVTAYKEYTKYAITDAQSRGYKFDINENGHITGITDPDGKAVAYSDVVHDQTTFYNKDYPSMIQSLQGIGASPQSPLPTSPQYNPTRPSSNKLDEARKRLGLK